MLKTQLIFLLIKTLTDCIKSLSAVCRYFLMKLYLTKNPSTKHKDIVISDMIVSKAFFQIDCHIKTINNDPQTQSYVIIIITIIFQISTEWQDIHNVVSDIRIGF